MKISTEELLQRLAKIEGEAGAEIPDGWELPGKLVPDFSELALDVLGVPQDDYNHETDTGYCRDWDYEQWFMACRGKISVRKFIERVK